MMDMNPLHSKDASYGVPKVYFEMLEEAHEELANKKGRKRM